MYFIIERKSGTYFVQTDDDGETQNFRGWLIEQNLKFEEYNESHGVADFINDVLTEQI